MNKWNLHEVWIYHPATCCWVKMWVDKSYNPDPPPPGAALRTWDEILAMR